MLDYSQWHKTIKNIDINHYLNLLESFKTYHISEFLLAAREKLIRIIGDYESPIVQKYFQTMEECRLFLRNTPIHVDNFPNNTNAAYVITPDKKLFYFNRKENKPLIEIPLSEDQFNNLQAQLPLEDLALDEQTPTKLLIERLSRAQKNQLVAITGHTHIEIEPFANFAHEPQQIVILKELTNALYHAELAFNHLKTIDSSSKMNLRPKDLIALNSTIDHGYQACYLLTHLDLNFVNEAFSEEISLIFQLYAATKTQVAGYKPQIDKISKLIKNYPLSYKAGVAVGTTINQMQPNTGKIDYNFLTQFSAVLPGYLEQMTTFIRKYTSDITHREPTLDKQKIEALQEDAIKLLNSINSLQDSNAVLSVKVLHYIRIIRHIITLSKSTFEQMGYMTETSQEAIRNNLAKIKYELLPQLFALADKIEDQAMLAPGMLSQSLMDTIVPFYNELIRLAKKPVDFSIKGKELLTIADSRFMNIRLQDTYQRIKDCQQHLLKIQQIEHAFNNFFTLLEDAGNTRLAELQPETKATLARYYRYLQPYFQKFDLAIDNEIIFGLTTKGVKKGYLGSLYGWVSRAKPMDGVENILSYKTRILESYKSDEATQHFHIQLNTDIINKAYHRAELSLHPHQSSENVLNVNEATALKFDEFAVLNFAVDKTNKQAILITRTELLTSDQALELYTYYDERRTKMKCATEAFSLFISIVRENNPVALHLLPNDTKEKLSRLYLVFQPYLVSTFAKDRNIDSLDRIIVDSLSPHCPANYQPEHEVSEALSPKTQAAFESLMTISIASSEERRDLYAHIAFEKYAQETEAKPLAPSAHDRMHYVLKNTNASQTVAVFRADLFRMTRFFNQAIKNQLKPAEEGIPFPELSDAMDVLAESQQLLSIKKLFNALYNLQQVLVQLEQLTHTSSKSVYVGHLIQAYGHIHSIYKLSKGLYNDPRFALLAREFTQKAQSIQQEFLAQSAPYLENGSSVTHTPGEIQYPALWYVLQGFMLAPEHIHALHEKTSLTEDELLALSPDELLILSQKVPLSDTELLAIRVNSHRIVINIQRVIANSNSYFKLFLEIPTMFKLFQELRQKLALFTNTAHAATLDHLRELKSTTFARMLIEADHWEDKLGLESGQLSSHLQAILDEFYKGLIKPLGLVSKLHIEYVTNPSTYDQRQEANNERIVKAHDRQVEAQQSIDSLNNLTKAINAYTDAINNPTMDNWPGVVAVKRNEMIDGYNAAHPLIMTANTHLNSSLPKEDNSAIIDIMIHQAIDSSWVQVNDIVKVTQTTVRYYQGILATAELEKLTAEEKDHYLQKQRLEQTILNKQFLAEYTNKAFDQRIEVIINEQTELLHINLEYNKKLRTHLLKFRNEIVALSLVSPDIEETIKTMLDLKFQEFNNDRLDYLQLDNVLSALAVFKVYIAKANEKVEQNRIPLFEDKNTLTKKTAQIYALEVLAYDENIPVKQRLTTMSKQVHSAVCTVDLLNYRTFDSVSFDWLSQCFLRLVSALHLYTPTYVNTYNQLSQSLTMKTDIDKQQRYMLFGAHAKSIQPANKALQPDDDEEEQVEHFDDHILNVSSQPSQPS